MALRPASEAALFNRNGSKKKTKSIKMHLTKLLAKYHRSQTGPRESVKSRKNFAQRGLRRQTKGNLKNDDMCID